MIAVIVGIVLSWLVPCVQVQGMCGVFVPAGVVRQIQPKQPVTMEIVKK